MRNARASGAVNREGVRNVAGHEYEAAGLNGQRVVADVHGELTVDDVDELESAVDEPGAASGALGREQL
jgi:hypothetical protein